MPKTHSEQDKIIDEKRPKHYRINAFIKGKGIADLYIWNYDHKGKASNKHTGSYFLPSDYQHLSKVFELPPNVKNFRVAFLLKENQDQPATIFIDDFKIERSVAIIRLYPGFPIIK